MIGSVFLNGYLLGITGLLALAVLFGFLLRATEDEWIEHESNQRIRLELLRMERDRPNHIPTSAQDLIEEWKEQQ